VNFTSRRRTFLILAAALWAGACGAARSSDVRVVKNITYYSGPGYDAKKHLLDLYLPGEAHDFPVLIFIHGGGWRFGDKDGLLNPYDRLGERFARNGIGVVVASYRLAPKYKFPACAEDVARAVRWTYENIAAYGGAPDRLFLCGHSAGAHLVALVALDENYLAARGVPADAVAGVIGISGPYDIEYLWEQAGWFARWFIGRPAFGNDAATRAAASAPNFVRADAPPFLLLYAEHDPAHLRDQTRRLARAFAEKGVSTPVKEIPGKNHYSTVLSLGREGDAATRYILDFIAARGVAEEDSP